MKKVLALIIVVILLKVPICVGQKGYERKVIETVLKTNEMVEILSLKRLDDRGSIRIVDNTKKFKIKRFTHIGDSTTQGISYLTVALYNKIPMDWNTGYFRDFYISSLKNLGKDTFKIEIYLSNYLCRGGNSGEKKSRLVFRLEYSIVNDKVVINSKELNIWH